jgi:hypothetical protein
MIPFPKRHLMRGLAQAIQPATPALASVQECWSNTGHCQWIMRWTQGASAMERGPEMKVNGGVSRENRMRDFVIGIFAIEVDFMRKIHILMGLARAMSSLNICILEIVTPTCQFALNGGVSPAVNSMGGNRHDASTPSARC